MRICNLVILLLCSMVLTPAWAAMLERSVPVSVSIVADQDSTDLEIVADKDLFLVVYDTASQRFHPLNIPFKVRSISGSNVAYDLFVSHLEGQCDNGQYPLVPSAMLDGSTVTVNEKRRFAGIENNHVVELSFPLINQVATKLYCEGSVGVIAELFI